MPTSDVSTPVVQPRVLDGATIAAYEKPVPRYTSYPTAAQFDASVGPRQHAGWLTALGGAQAALYLHVPFCQELCWYCACNTMAMRRSGALDGYTRALTREIELVAAAAPDMVLDAVQWGGGTPSQLGAHRIVALAGRIASLFDRRCDAEISVEVDPRQCDEENAAAFGAIGATRASIGVQDFDEAVQAAINRRQSVETTAGALARLRAAGIRRFNIDLVYGLPRQTLQTLERTMDAAIALAPDRFAVFAYAHVPWMKPHQKLIDRASLPGSAERAAMAELVRNKLEQGGYRPVGLDHFAREGDALALASRDGTVRRSFQGYGAARTPWVVGVGASAISSLPAGYSQNVADAARYMAAIGAGDFATARGIGLTADDRLRGDIIARLMCGDSADIAAACRAHRIDTELFIASLDALPRLIDDGLAVLDGDTLRLTERGRPLVRSVCAAFDRYYTGQEGRHSRGI